MTKKTKKEPEVLATWIMCPDGVMLPSFSNHDFRDHITIDEAHMEHPQGKPEPEMGEEWMEWHREREQVITKSRYSMVDGGPDTYSRRGGVYTEMSVYSDDPFSVIRRFLCRGGRGKDGTEYLTWVPLFRMSDEWLQATIDYVLPSNKYLKYYKKEAKYRKKHGISIPE